MWLAVKTLLSPWLWYDRGRVQATEQSFSRYLQNKSVVLTSSGRTALYQLLKAFEIGDGDEVILQAFTCVSVPAPIVWVGAKPVFVDIDPHTLNIDLDSLKAAVTTNTKAIIVQHTFGNPAPMTEILKIAKEQNLVVIEDCAHALGSVKDGQLVGTLGDAAIFSFGRDKSISSVFGGAVTAHNPQILARVRTQLSKLGRAPRWWIIQQLLHPILFSVIKPIYFTARLGQMLLILFQKIGLLSKAVRVEERSAHQPPHSEYAFPAALAILLAHQIGKIERFTKRRTEVAEEYINALNLPLTGSQKPSWLRVPVRVENSREFFDKARAQNMLLGDWYSSPVFPVTDPHLINYVPGSCPNAESAAKEILNLPTYPTLTDTQVQKVITFVRDNN